MKRVLVVGLLGILGIVFMAAGCQVVNISLTPINNHDVFAGELKNDSGANILNHKFRVAFLDSNNNLLETKTVDGCLRSVQNGKSDFFSVASSLSTASTATGLARLANLQEDSTFKIGDTVSGDLTVSNLRFSRDADTLTVKGTLKNNDNAKAFDPVICVVVRDNDGNVVVTAKSSILSDLSENGTVDFTVTTAVSDDVDLFDSVDLWWDALDASTNGTPLTPKSDLNNGITECGTPTNTPTKTNTPAATNTVDPSATATNTPTATNTATATTTPPANTNTPTATATACGG